MINVIVILILILGIIFGIQSFLKRASGKSCCSSGDSEVRIKPADKNRSHYTYRAEMSVQGMTCGNCALRVENALNSLDGVMAKVNLKKNTVSLMLKQTDTDKEQMLTAAVADAGYTATGIRLLNT